MTRTKLDQYEITYFLMPESANIKITIIARTEEEAIIFAKQYRREGFAITKKN